MPTTTPTQQTDIQRVQTLIGNCALCGKAAWWGTPSEAAQILETDESMKTGAKHELGPLWRNKIMGLGPFVCSSCALRAEELANIRRRRENAHVARRDAYGLGLMPHEATQTTFDASDEAVEARNVESWAMAKHVPLDTNLWIFGTPGTGKTFLARCVCNAYLDDGLSAAELSAIAVHEAVRHFDEKLLTRYRTPAVLLLEDVDKPKWTAEGLTALWALLDKRNGNGLRLLVTANAEPDALRKSWLHARPDNASVVSTLLERMLPMTRLELKGDSIRRQLTGGKTDAAA